MALVFTKDITTDKLLMAFNNNVVKFYSDNEQQPLNCDITGLGLNVKIYPHPDGTFYFNFMDYASPAVNTKKFADDLQVELEDGNSDSFTYDVTDGTFIGGIITFKINFPDASVETDTRFLNFLAGVYQLEDYKSQEIMSFDNYVILSPVKKRSNNTVNLKYWEGYPFEFSFYTSTPNTDFTLKNNTTGIGYDFFSKGTVTSLCLSDGRTDISIEDFLPLVDGTNELNIIAGGHNQGLNILLNKADSDCGVYVKWFNKLGRWNYWLLNKINFRERSAKYNPELDNDFENPEDTFSPTIQTGKTSGDVLKCNVSKLTEAEKDVFIGILESPKIYLFTGERFSRSSSNDWIEVSLKTNSLKIVDGGRKYFKYNLDFDLPGRYMQAL